MFELTLSQFAPGVTRKARLGKISAAPSRLSPSVLRYVDRTVIELFCLFMFLSFLLDVAQKAGERSDCAGGRYARAPAAKAGGCCSDLDEAAQFGAEDTLIVQSLLLW